MKLSAKDRDLAHARAIGAARVDAVVQLALSNTDGDRIYAAMQCMSAANALLIGAKVEMAPAEGVAVSARVKRMGRV